MTPTEHLSTRESIPKPETTPIQQIFFWTRHCLIVFFQEAELSQGYTHTRHVAGNQFTLCNKMEATTQARHGPSRPEDGWIVIKAFIRKCDVHVATAAVLTREHRVGPPPCRMALSNYEFGNQTQTNFIISL